MQCFSILASHFFRTCCNITWDDIPFQVILTHIVLLWFRHMGAYWKLDTSMVKPVAFNCCMYMASLGPFSKCRPQKMTSMVAKCSYDIISVHLTLLVIWKQPVLEWIWQTKPFCNVSYGKQSKLENKNFDTSACIRHKFTIYYILYTYNE